MELRHIHKTYGELEIFHAFSLKIDRGDVVCLLGPSGCGKSTLLKIIAGLDTDYTGDVLGFDTGGISYVFQESRLIPWLTVHDNLKYVLKGQIQADKLDAYIDDFLRKVGLTGAGNKYPKTLSGGMKQRVSLARAFSMPHEILLMDEPFQGLNMELKEQLMTLLEDLIKQDQKTVIMVTHDLGEAFRLGSKVYKLIGQPISGCQRLDESI